jgi:wyosine [tRNA(Phe)-imidazoG37] synthetase (radical SAM superfamily)
LRDGWNSNNFKQIDSALINKHKETIVNLLEDFDFEERLAMIKEIINTYSFSSNLEYLKLALQPSKSLFGSPVFDNINSYKS